MSTYRATGLALLFILLYGSGFVGAKLGLPYAEPLTFLALRFAITTALLLLAALLLRSPWPGTAAELLHIAVAGLLLVATFSVGVFVSLELGISPAVCALIIAGQPALVAVLGRPLLGQRVGGRQWLGIAIGFVGVSMVVWKGVPAESDYPAAVLLAVVGLLGLTLGNLYQKRFCGSMPILTGGLIQSGISAAAVAWLALALDEGTVRWSAELLIALSWMSIAVSIGALSILYLLIRSGETTRVASVFYLVPVSTALIAYTVLGSTLSLREAAGMMVAVAGVYLINTGRRYRVAHRRGGARATAVVCD